mmetsp:Transcript_676/g.1630  ORF Transcript_676/g.1630 Transcript_676/m.1630 type:complete len:310 (-) Transcript_676:56-985(-)
MTEEKPSFDKKAEESAKYFLREEGAQSRDHVQRYTIASFVTSSLFFLTSTFLIHPEPWRVLQNSFAALGICFVIDSIVGCVAPAHENRFLVSHYILFPILTTSFAIIYFVSKEWFASMLNSVFFGPYLFDWIGLLTQKDHLSANFRVFLSTHHSMTFVAVSIWAMVAPCCFEDNNDYVYRGIVIWFANCWGYLLKIYRVFHPKADQDFTRRMQVVVFVMERIQNCAAYLQGFTVPVSDLNTFWWVVVGSGLLMDAIDTTFQAKSILKLYRQRVEDGTNQHSTSDVETPVDLQGDDTDEREEIILPSPNL